jgi:hypothetical protein
MLRDIIADQLKILTFQRPSNGIALHWRQYLIYGFFVTWLAGIGRYWDNPKAHLFQHLGLGSLAYVIILAGLLWLIYMPLRPTKWQFRNILLFITLCSLPALLYAIPVERFMPMEAAQSANAWFLGIVATWRVALLSVFLTRVAQLRPVVVFVATLLPLALIVTTLTLLNLEHVVFDIMAGIEPENRSPNDLAYTVVVAISFFSVITLPILFIAYGVLVYRERRTST